MPSAPSITLQASATDTWAERCQQFAKGQVPPDLNRVDDSATAGKAPREVFVYFIREGKRRAPQAAMALQQRVNPPD